MTWVDAIVLLILACSALIAFLRGFVREALGVCAWIGGFYFAMVFFGTAQPEVRKLIPNPEIADPVALALLFIFGLIAFSILASLVARMVRLSALGGLDRTIGLLFGVLRGALLVMVAYICVEWAGLTVAMWPDAVLGARTLPIAYQGAAWIADQEPFGLHLKVDPPPPVGSGSVNELMQQPPHGFARDGRVAPPSVDNPAPDAPAPQNGQNR